MPVHLSGHDTAQMLRFNIQSKNLKNRFFLTSYKRDYNIQFIRKFQQYLQQLSWSDAYTETELNSAFKKLYDLFCLLYKLCFLIIRVKIKTNKCNENWISQGLKNSCKTKRYLRFIYYKNKNDLTKNHYISYSTTLKRCIFTANKRSNIKYI